MAPPQNSTLLHDDENYFELTSSDTSRYSPILPLKTDEDSNEDYKEDREHGGDGDGGGGGGRDANVRKSIRSTNRLVSLRLSTLLSQK